MTAGERKVEYQIESDYASKPKFKGLKRCDIVRLAYAGMQPFVNARDLCLLRFARDTSHEVGALPNSGTRLELLAQSVEHGLVPPRESHTRAELHQCGYRMTLHKGPDGPYTDVVYISSLDFKGNFPYAFTNVILTQQPATLEAMRDVIAGQVAKTKVKAGEGADMKDAAALKDKGLEGKKEDCVIM